MTIALLSIGAIGGLLAGMFGVGGGFIMVPLLVLWAGFDQRRAAATSLLAIIPTGIVASIGYAVQGQVDYLIAAIIAAGALAGVPIGTALLRRLPVRVLSGIFLVALVAAAIRLVVSEPERGARLDLDPLIIIGLIVLGVVMGIAAGMLGVGGGIIAVPALVGLFGMGDLVSRGTSLLALLPGAVSGSVGHLRRRTVRARDAALLAGPAAVMSLVGVLLAGVIPPQLGNYLLAALLVLVGVQLAIKQVRKA